jgi:hypothetical protein
MKINWLGVHENRSSGHFELVATIEALQARAAQGTANGSS